MGVDHHLSVSMPVDRWYQRYCQRKLASAHVVKQDHDEKPAEVVGAGLADAATTGPPPIAPLDPNQNSRDSACSVEESAPPITAVAKRRAAQNILDIVEKYRKAHSKSSAESGDDVAANMTVRSQAISTPLPQNLGPQGTNLLSEQLAALSATCNEQPSGQLGGIQTAEDSIAKCKKKRVNIVYELYTTEVSYVNGLRALHCKYAHPLSALTHSPASIISKNEVDILFSNLNEIMSINLAFLSQLEMRLFRQSKSGLQANQSLEEDLPMFSQYQMTWFAEDIIGDIIVEIIPFFKAYSTFVKNFENGLALISDLFAHGGRFCEFLQSRGPNPKLTLQSLLILPVQRIPRYRLLLKDLLSTSAAAFEKLPEGEPVGPEMEQELVLLEKALGQVDLIANFINESIRQHERASEVIEFQKRMVGCSVSLMAPSRRLVLTGKLRKVSRKSHDERFVLLFSDMIMITSEVPPNKLLHHHSFPFSAVLSVQQSKTVADSIEIMTRTKSFILVAESPKDFAKWKDAIIAALGGYYANRTSMTEAAISKSHRLPGPPSSELSSDTAAVSIPSCVPVIADHVAPIWIPDDMVTGCQVCSQSFSLFFRRHHCRMCGRVACSDCCGGAYIFYIKGMEAAGPEKCCRSCYQEQLASRVLNPTNTDWNCDAKRNVTAARSRDAPECALSGGMGLLKSGPEWTDSWTSACQGVSVEEAGGTWAGSIEDPCEVCSSPIADGWCLRSDLECGMCRRRICSTCVCGHRKLASLKQKNPNVPKAVRTICDACYFDNV